MENSNIKDIPDGAVFFVTALPKGGNGVVALPVVFTFHLWKNSPLRRLFESQEAFEVYKETYLDKELDKSGPF